MKSKGKDTKAKGGTTQRKAAGSGAESVGELPAADKGLEEVREILFGTHLVGEERQIQQLRERFQGLESLRREDAEKLNTLAQELRSEIRTVAETVRAGEEQRVRDREEMIEKLEKLGHDVVPLALLNPCYYWLLGYPRFVWDTWNRLWTGQAGRTSKPNRRAV